MTSETSEEATLDDDSADDSSVDGGNQFHAEAKPWQVILGGILTLLAPAAVISILVWKDELEAFLSVDVDQANEMSGGHIWATAAAMLAAPLLLLLGFITPFRGPCFLDTPEPPVSAMEAWRRSFGKLRIFVSEVLLFAAGFYLNLVTEWDVLAKFWAMPDLGFFHMKAGLLVMSAIWAGAVAFRDLPVPQLQLRGCLAVIAALRLLPACLFILGLTLFINNPSAEWLQFGLTPFRKLSASSGFVEVFTLALPSMQIEIFALLSGTPLDDRGELFLSSLVSLLSAAVGFASIDSKAVAIRHVSGIPTVIGTADSLSISFLLVLLFRLCNIGSRVLIFPFLFAYKGALAGFVFVTFDLLTQLGLVWRATQSPTKLPFAAANIFSAAEPLLLNEGPFLTVSIKYWSIVQFVELVAIVVLCLCDPGAVHQAHHEEPVLTVLFVVFSVMQWPIIIAVRACFTCEFDGADAQPVLDAMGHSCKVTSARTGATTATSGTVHMHRKADAADARAPIGLARHVWWPMLRSKDGTWNGSLQGFGDRGVRVVSKLLREDPLCKSLWLEMNAIGDDGAILLAEALKDTDTLEWLDLNMNCITDVGAQALVAALRQRHGCLRKIWLKQNPIQDLQQIKADLEHLVESSLLDDADQEMEQAADEEDVS